MPTFREAGLPDVVVVTHWCFYGPAGLETPLAESLGNDLMRAVLDDSVKAELEKQGYVPLGTNATQHAEILREEYEKWGGVMRRANNMPANEAR